MALDLLPIPLRRDVRMIWQFRDVVVTDYANFVRVIGEDPAELGEAIEPPAIMIRSRGGEGGDWVIILGEFCAEVVGISGMKQPLVTLPNRHAAMAQGMAE